MLDQVETVLRRDRLPNTYFDLGLLELYREDQLMVEYRSQFKVAILYKRTMTLVIYSRF